MTEDADEVGADGDGSGGGGARDDTPEPEFTPEEFEERKYTEYFPQLQSAYKRAFSELNEAYDSTLVHGIDQQILNESEPVYEGDGVFDVRLPEDPLDRLTGVVVEDDRAAAVLEEYVEELERQLRRTFAGVE